MSNMSQAEITDIAERAAETTLRRLMITIGIDINDPLKAQRDFAVMREIGALVMDPEFRKDIEHTRAWRLTLQSVRTKSMLTAIGIVVTGLMAAMAVAIRSYLGGAVPPPHP